MNVLGSSQRTDQTDQAINALFDTSDDNEHRSQGSSQQAFCGKKRTRPEGGSSNELSDSDSESEEPSTKYRKLDSSRETVRVSTRGSSSGGQNCIASRVRHEDERQQTQASRGEGRELTFTSAEQPQEPSSVERIAMQDAAPGRKPSFKSIIEGLRQQSDERQTSQKRRLHEFTDDDIFNEDNDLNRMLVTGRDIHDPYREREDDEVDWEDDAECEQARASLFRQLEGVTLVRQMEIDPFSLPALNLKHALPETPRLKSSELQDQNIEELGDELHQSHSSSSSHSYSDNLSSSSSHSNSDSHSSSRVNDLDSEDFMSFIEDSEESDIEESSVQYYDSDLPDEMLLDTSSYHSSWSDDLDPSIYDSDSSNTNREQLLSLEDVNKISLFTLTEADIEFIQTKAKKQTQASAEGASSSMLEAARPEHKENEGTGDEASQPTENQANKIEPLTEEKSLASPPPYINPEDPIAGAYELIEELFNERSLDFERFLERQPECIICMKGYQVGDQVRVLKPCLHNYHAVCIDRWLTEERGMCPVDRLKVDLCGKVD